MNNIKQTQQHGYLMSSDHQQFRELVAGFVKKEMLPFHEQWEKDQGFPKELFKKIADLGVLGLRVDPEYGGAGLDYWYTVILCEELVRSCSIGVAVAILAHAEFAVKVIEDEGSHSQKNQYLSPAMAGEMIWALGLTEPDYGSNVAAIKTSARRDGDDFVINGSKIFISNGGIADYITTAVRTSGDDHKGISLVVVPADAKGFTVGKKLDKMSVRSGDTALLHFEDVRVPVSNLVGEENKGFYYIMDHFQGERLVLSSFANGTMNVLWDIALEYGNEREVFGKRLLDHQIWKHRLADLYTNMLASKQLTYHACNLLNSKSPANSELSAAKIFTCDHVKKMANEVLQMHGGYGLMEEYPIAKLYRDVSGFTIGAGTSEVMREIIANEQLRV